MINLSPMPPPPFPAKIKSPHGLSEIHSDVAMPRAGHITLLSPMERHQNVCKSNEKCNPPPSWNWSKIQSTKIFRWCRREYGQWPVGLALTKPGGSSVIVIKTTTGARPLKRAPEFPSEGGCAVPRCSHSTGHVTLKQCFKNAHQKNIRSCNLARV